jgi:hypothetical protein
MGATEEFGLSFKKIAKALIDRSGSDTEANISCHTRN